ncbi:PIN domain-containing protein [Aurantiacibacter flavus]|uniref:PIN domain-containing protein n=1 Tax=Aurantiacibacter flavus TaxID=3145232 RepID=A0ABV0CXG4_9SPHN
MKHSRYTAVFDACVLYPAPLRDLLLELSSCTLFRAKWSNEIHAEWIDALLKKRDDLDRSKLERTRDLMNSAILDCLVEGHMDLVPILDLPDPNDRHVLAAAIHSGSDAIITFNSKDFPEEVRDRYDIEVLHPDDFIRFQFDFDNAAVILAAQRCRERLKNPAINVSRYLETLAKQGLTKTVDALAPFSSVL